MKTKLRKQIAALQTQTIEFPDDVGKTRFQSSNPRRIAKWQRPLIADEIELSGGEDMLVPDERVTTRLGGRASSSSKLNQNSRKLQSDRTLAPLHFSGSNLDFPVPSREAETHFNQITEIVVSDLE